MNWFLTIVSGVICAVAGGFAAGFIANTCVTWYRVTSREGAAGYFVVFTALMGCVAGFVIGAVVSRYAPGGRFGPGLLYGLGAVTAISLVAYALAWLNGDVPPEIDGSRLNLAVELRSPEGWKLTNRMKSGYGWLILGSVDGANRERASGNSTLQTREARLEGGRTIIPGSVYVFTTTGRRVVRVEIGGKHLTAFEVPLPAKPDRKYLDWSEWRPAGEGFDFRFRIERTADLRRQDEEEAAAQRRKFGTLTESSPLAEYLEFLDDHSWDVRNKVGTITAQRAAELIPLIENGEGVVLSRALRAAAAIPTLPPAFEQPLLVRLAKMTAELKRLRETETAGDPDSIAGLELKNTFISWFSAWRRAHPDGVVLPPELLQLMSDAGGFQRDGSMGDARAIEELGKHYIEEWKAAQ